MIFQLRPLLHVCGMKHIGGETPLQVIDAGVIPGRSSGDVIADCRQKLLLFVCKLWCALAHISSFPKWIATGQLAKTRPNRWVTRPLVNQKMIANRATE